MKYYILKFLFLIFSRVIPIKKRLYIFGAWSGERFSDNPKEYFKYLHAKNLKEVYWYTKNKNLFNEMQNDGFPCVIGVSFKTIWMHMRAEAVFCNCSAQSDVIGFAINKKTKIFNLWHGSPMKHIGLDALKSCYVSNSLGVKEVPFFVQFIYKKMSWFVNKVKNEDVYFLASSKEVASILSRAMNIEPNKVILSGYPKLDPLFSTVSNNLNDPFVEKHILLCPTYRGEYGAENDILHAMGLDIIKTNEILVNKNIVLTIRLHPANRLKPTIINQLSHVKNINIDNEPDIYTTLQKCDAIITDFSSIYFDALAIGMNAIFFPFEYEEYIKNDRKLYYKPDELCPYSPPKTWTELLNNLDGLLMYPIENFKSIRDRFYEFPQKESCALLHNRINEKLN